MGESKVSYEQLTVSSILAQTYKFVVLRFVVICATLAPIILIVRYYMNFLIRLFGLEVTGFVRNVFLCAFGYVGFLVGWTLFDFVRKTLLFYLKAGHIIAITKLCVEDEIEVGLMTDSLKQVMDKFISVNLFYVADGLLLKGLDEVGRVILSQDIMPILKSNNIITKFAGKTIKTTLSYSDELVLSYVFFRCRIKEVYGTSDEPKKGRKKHSSTKRKDSAKEMIGYAVDGMCLYVKSCLGLMKSAFITVLAAEIFSWILSIIIVIVMLFALNQGLFRSFITFLILRVVYEIVVYTFLEPYQIAALTLEFYNVISDETEDLNVDSVRDKLSGMSSAFKRLVDTAFGREATDSKVSASGPILEKNLLELAKSGVIEAASGESVGEE